MADGTIRTAVLPDVNHLSPINAKDCGAGIVRQSLGNCVGSTLSIWTSEGISAWIDTNRFSASSISMWTKVSSPARESVAEV